MLTEKRYLAISPRAFIIDGGADGAILLSDTIDIKVGQVAILSSDTQSQLRVKVNRVASNQLLYVGEVDKPVENRLDISAYTAVDNATIAIPEQKRTTVPQQEIERITYDEEPVIARRVIPVDPYGSKFTSTNPFPVRPSDGEDQLSISDNGAAYVTQGYASILSTIAGLPWVVRSNYDEIAPIFGADTVDLVYRERGSDIGLVTLNFDQETGIWNFISESYLVNSDGERLLDDDDTELDLS